MNIARYLMSAMALNLPAVPAVPAPRPSLTIPPPDPNERVWKWEEIQRIAMDEIRKNKDKWPWIAGITGTQIHELSKITANAIDRIDKTNNARNRKLGIGPRKYVESTLRAFMPGQSRNYASLVMEPLQKNPATEIKPKPRTSDEDKAKERALLAAKSELKAAKESFLDAKKSLELAQIMRNRAKLQSAEEKMERAEDRLAKATRLHADVKRNGGIFIRSRDGWYSGYPQPQLHVNPRFGVNLQEMTVEQLKETRMKKQTG